MEVAIVKDNSLKIKGEKTVIVTDPISKIEAQVVILTDSGNYELDKVEGTRLVISGQGEYEVGGISIVGKDVKGDIVYTLSDSYNNVLIVPSSLVSKIQEENEYSCVLIKVVDEIKEDAFSVFNSKCFVIYGNIDLAKLKSEDIEKTSKINLRKTGEISGKIFILS